MANDPSMPPSEQNPGAPVDNSPAMAAPAAPAASSPEGNVMISMPKPVFDAMHKIVGQLAMTLDQLKGTVDNPQGGPAAVAPQVPAPTAPGASAEDQVAGDTDEDFLKGLAEEGNQR